MRSGIFKLVMAGTLLAGLVGFSTLGAKKDAATTTSSDTPLTLSSALNRMAEQLTANAPRLSRAKVAVADFLELNQKTIPLCAYWPDNLSSALVKTGKVDVLERRMIMQVLTEQKFQVSDLAKPEIIKKAGKLLGADWIVTGTITVFDSYVEINGRVLDVKTGQAVSSSVVRVFKQEVANLLGTPAAPPVPATPAPAPAPPPAPVVTPPAQDQLTITFGFMAAINTAAGTQVVSIQPGMALHSGDMLKVLFKASRDCHVYVLQFGSSGKASIIFPEAKIALGNPVKADTFYYIPPANQWYFLDKNPGQEKMLLVASIQPLPNLDQLVAQLQSASGDPAVISRSISAEVDNIFKSRGAGEAGKGIDITGTPAAKGPQERGIGESGRPIATAGTEGKNAKSKGAAGSPIEVGGTAGFRDIGGVTAGPEAPVQLINNASAQAPTNVLSGTGLVARELIIVHLP